MNHTSLDLKRWNRCAVVVSLLLVLATGCSKSPSPKLSKHTGDGRIYDEKNGFSFVPPKAWQPGAPRGSTILSFLGDSAGGFTTNVNVTVTADDGLAIESAPASLKEAMPQYFTAWKCIEDGFETIGDKKAYRICSTYEQGHFVIQMLQYLFRGNNQKLYTLTFTTTHSQYDKLKDTFAWCASSVITD